VERSKRHRCSFSAPLAADMQELIPQFDRRMDRAPERVLETCPIRQEAANLAASKHMFGLID